MGSNPRFGTWIARVVAVWSVSLACAVCLASPTTFVLAQSQRRSGFDTYDLKFAPIADDPELDTGLKKSFEGGFLAGLEGASAFGALRDAHPTPRTLVLHYRAAGISEGSLAARAGSAAVNAFLPVSVIPEIGGGDLGVETTFLDSDGTVAGRILVQANVRGLLSTDAGTMQRIGVRTGEYMSSHFGIRSADEDARSASDGALSTHVVNVSPERVKLALATLEPLIGEWDMTFEIQVTGRPPVKARVRETNRWEAGGRMFFQFAETLDSPEQLFRCNAVTWDPAARSLIMFSFDSVFGAHDSHDLAFERIGQTLKGTSREKDRVMEVVGVFGEDGLTRHETKSVWTADRSRLLLTIRSEGSKRR